MMVLVKDEVLHFRVALAFVLVLSNGLGMVSSLQLVGLNTSHITVARAQLTGVLAR